MKDRRTRQLSFYGVLAIGFLWSVVVAFGVFFGWVHLHPATAARLLFRIAYQIVGLLSLYLALRYQGRTFKEIGLVIDPRLLEIGRAFGLYFVAIFLTVSLYLVLNLLSPRFQPLAHHGTFDSAALFGVHVTIASLLFVVLNPFHEELLVRAFLITEVEGLYHSTLLAVIVSVALQTSYHIYQGLPAALSHIPAFLIFSLYYVRTRRIFPIILAHLFMDISALALYAQHHR